MHESAPQPARATHQRGSATGFCALIAALVLLAHPPGQAQNAPQVTSVTPANGVTGVALTAPLVFVFDQPMADWVPIMPTIPNLFVGNLELSPDTAPSVDGEWSDDGYSLTCTPSSEWPPNTTITWKLNPTDTALPISNKAGIALATVSGNFTTGSGGGGGGDVPELVSSTPDNGALGVPVDTLVTFLFSLPMKKTTPIGDAVSWMGTGVDPAKFVYSWSADGLTLQADYTGDLPSSTFVTWVLNPEGSTVQLESDAGELLPADTYAGGFLTGQGGGGDDCYPDGIPDTWGGYSLAKHASYSQTSANDPVPAAERPFSFGAFVVGPAAGPTATSGSVTLPNATRHNLQSGGIGSILYYSDEPASEAVLNTAYPAGDYTLRFTRTGEAERAVSMTMPATFPPVPKIANFVEAQAVNHAQDFTLRWNAFTGAGANDHISLIVTATAPMPKVVFQAPDLCVPRELPVTATSIVLPANTLENNKTYSATLSFNRMFYFSTNTVPDMAGIGLLSRETQFTIKTGTGGTGAAARFTGYRLLPDGTAELTLTGTPQALYTIQRTSSVGTPHWTTAGAVTMTPAGTAVFLDPQARTLFPLFYRAVAN